MSQCQHQGCETRAAIKAHFAPYPPVYLCGCHYLDLQRTPTKAEREFFERCGVNLEQEKAHVAAR